LSESLIDSKTWWAMTGFYGFDFLQFSLAHLFWVMGLWNHRKPVLSKDVGQDFHRDLIHPEKGVAHCHTGMRDRQRAINALDGSVIAEPDDGRSIVG
jgi:hypothetical protein